MHILIYIGNIQTIKDIDKNIYKSTTIIAKSSRELAINYLNKNIDVDIIIDNAIKDELKFSRFIDALKMKLDLNTVNLIVIDDSYNRKLYSKYLNNEIFELYDSSSPINNIFYHLEFAKSIDLDKFTSSNYSENDSIPKWKRLFDIVVASFAIIFLSPVMILTALLIRIESKGKIYYTSKRVGKGFRVFNFYKFRSMVVDADSQLNSLTHLNQYESKIEKTENDSCFECAKLGKACSPILFFDDKKICEKQFNSQKIENTKATFLKINNDPRVTKVGEFIRKTSIDELPQLFNVLKGEMSIIGNRPLPLYEAELLTSDEWVKRFKAPAGLTGLWQVEKRAKSSEMSPTERKELDNLYADNSSFISDLRLLLRTFPALLQKENV